MSERISDDDVRFLFNTRETANLHLTYLLNGSDEAPSRKWLDSLVADRQGLEKMIAWISLGARAEFLIVTRKDSAA